MQPVAICTSPVQCAAWQLMGDHPYIILGVSISFVVLIVAILRIAKR